MVDAGRVRDEAATDPPAGGWAAFRTWGLFVVVFAALLALLLRFGGYVQAPAMHGTAHATAWMLRLLGAEAHASGSIVDSSLYSADIILECTAVFPLMIYVSAVIAYPAGVRRKLLGLAAGIPALLALNQVRLLSLFYLGHWYPNAVETAHLVVWQSLMVFFTLLLWLVWAAGAGVRRGDRPA